MEPPIYQRKWEAVERALKRLEEYYNGKIDNIDSFNGPKDFVYAYFHATYSLKEAIKALPGFGGKNGVIENFIKKHSVAIGIDISNSEKHGALSNPKSHKKIGTINSHVHIFDPQGKDRTELTIEIDGLKYDCLSLATKNYTKWRIFLLEYDLISKS